LVVFAEKEFVRRDGHYRAQAEQELEDVGPDSAENRHALQEFDRPFVHGGGSTATPDRTDPLRTKSMRTSSSPLRRNRENPPRLIGLGSAVPW
jgi:hypothetical protein